MKFEEHNFEGIGSLVSLPSSQRKGQRVFFATNVARFFGHSNITQALKDAECIKFDASNQQECDYTTLKKKDAKDFFDFLVNIGKNRVTKQQLVTPLDVGISENTPNITLLTESGVWKLALKSKLKVGVQLRDWLAKKVLPSISATGTYTMKPSNLLGNALQMQELQRLTAQSEQIQESKDVNKFQMEKRSCKFDIINYNKKNHQMVHGRTTKELKAQYPDLKNSSGKEILRQKEPVVAITLATNDWFVRQGVELDKLQEVDRIVPQLLIAMQNLGLSIENFAD